jgi:predicted nucleic acid-binding protein
VQYHESVAASYVLDTDVMVAAVRSDRGASRQLLLAAVDQQFELLLSVPLILEYEAVLTRPQHLAACGLSSAEVGRVLDDPVAIASRFDLHSDGGQGYRILMTTWFWKRQSTGVPAQL